MNAFERFIEKHIDKEWDWGRKRRKRQKEEKHHHIKK
jgi:hypothetical protein